MVVEEVEEGCLSDAETVVAEDEPRPRAVGVPAYGTADPHGTGDVDRAPGVRRRAVSLSAHVAADDGELASRPFPQANVPAATEPRAPLAPPAPPPVVTDRLQVAPAATWRLEARWRRRLRRCFAAAARGDLSLARRLRPDDLWLPHAEHSCAATAPWDWDMRPLLEGLPAVPLPVSGQDGVLPSTSLVLPAVAAAGVGYADQAIISEMLQGVRDDSRCERGTLLCAPHIGALRELSVAVAKATGDITEGWARGPYAAPPCWPMRTCPYSVVDESERAGRPKYRLTIDLSWPHPGAMRTAGGWVESVNDAMDRSAWPAERLMRVREYAEAAAILRGSASPNAPRRAAGWSFDAHAFYRVVGRQRSELWRNVIAMPEGYRADERCCFGDASAAAKCVRMSNFVAWLVVAAMDAVDAAHPTRDAGWMAWQVARRAEAQRLGLSAAQTAAFARLGWFGLYVDDGSGASADDLLFDAQGRAVLGADGLQRTRAHAHFEAARDVLQSLGWTSEPSKEQPPAQLVVILGVEVDFGAARVCLTDAKRRRYASAAAAALASSAVSAGEMDRLVGRLQFAAQCYPIGRQYMHALWRCARVRSRRRDGRLPLGSEARRELRWWLGCLAAPGDGSAQGPLVYHCGVPLASLGAAGDGEALSVYADASGEGGWSAWAIADGALLLVGGTWSASELPLLIQEKEYLASTWALAAFRPWIGRRVVSFTDNVVVRAALSSATPRSPCMQLIAARRSAWLLSEGIVEDVLRITTHANIWADVGSRPELGGVAAVGRMACAAGLTVTPVAVPAEWRGVEDLVAGAGEWCR